MSDKALIELGKRVDHLTIAMADLLDACAIYERYIQEGWNGWGENPLTEAARKRQSAIDKLHESASR